jgi:hypothetical protein
MAEAQQRSFSSHDNYAQLASDHDHLPDYYHDQYQ